MIQVASGGSSSAKTTVSSNPFVKTSNSYLTNINQAANAAKNNNKAIGNSQVGMTVVSFIPPMNVVTGPLSGAVGIIDAKTNNAATKTILSSTVKGFSPVAAQNAALGAPGYALAQDVKKAAVSTYNGVVNTAKSMYNGFANFVNPANYR